MTALFARNRRGSCSSYAKDSWKTVCRRRQGGELGVGLGLIPVGYGIEIVGTAVAVAMLDGDADGFFEGDGAFGVPAVEAITAT